MKLRLLRCVSFKLRRTVTDADPPRLRAGEDMTGDAQSRITVKRARRNEHSGAVRGRLRHWATAFGTEGIAPSRWRRKSPKFRHSRIPDKTISRNVQYCIGAGAGNAATLRAVAEPNRREPLEDAEEDISTEALTTRHGGPDLMICHDAHPPILTQKHQPTTQIHP